MANDNPVTKAFEVVDKELGTLNDRELVSTGEVTDVLLDVRSLLIDISGLLAGQVQVDHIEVATNA